MTTVYGNQIEPEGMELEDESVLDSCPRCDKLAQFRSYETCHSGAINECWSITCGHCGYRDTNDIDAD